MFNKSLYATIGTAFASLVIVANVNAASLTETVDVGEFTGNAGQTNSQPSGTTLDSISGSLADIPNGDIDLFQILAVGGSFSATTDTAGTDPFLDTQLFLFDANGIGIAASNDIDAFNFSSTISITLAPGTYYIGISSFGSDPRSPGGDIFIIPTTGQVNPANGPGAGSSLSSWSANGAPGSGSYSIGFTGAQFVGETTPVPFGFNPIWGLLILGIWGTTTQWRSKK
ncbi:MAG TPA: hypothetical protein V6D28_17575 [Leptolyngbyaceae cyanobacterium]